MAEKDYADITLDRERKLRYHWQDIRELTRRLGGVTLQELLQKLAQADPEVISLAVFLGLRHEGKTTMEDVDNLLDAYFRREDGRLSTLLDAISEAIQATGLLRTGAAKKESAPGNP